MTGASESSVTLQILEGIIERLSETLPEIAVDFYPDTPERYRMSHPVGAVLVGFGGSTYLTSGATYAETQDTEYVAQDRTIYIPIVVQVRQLRGRTGAIEILDRLRQGLLGFAPPHAGPLKAERERFIEAADGVWSYGADYSCQTLAVMDAEGEQGPALLHLTLGSPYGDRELYSDDYVAP